MLKCGGVESRGILTMANYYFVISCTWDTMDVRDLHIALQFQILAEMDDMLALVTAAFYSPRRVGFASGIPSRLFHSFFSQFGAAERGLCLHPN